MISARVATIYKADSRLVKQVTPAALCGVWRSGGNLQVRGWPNITHVVIHTLIGTAASTISHWNAGQDCFPPHYVINKNGEITQMVAEYYYAQHAGTANTYSIGIEHEGANYYATAGDPKKALDYIDKLDEAYIKRRGPKGDYPTLPQTKRHA